MGPRRSIALGVPREARRSMGRAAGGGRGHVGPGQLRPVRVSARTDLARTRRRFDKWAAQYERDPISRWLAGLQDEAIRALELTLHDRLLDVGCGTGAAVRRAADIVQRAVGVDLSEAMVARARELAGALPNVSFRRAESAELPFEDGEFTAVLCTTSFHHYPDPRGAVREMERVLARGGRVVMGDAVSDRLAARFIDAINRAVDP